MSLTAGARQPLVAVAGSIHLGLLGLHVTLGIGRAADERVGPPRQIGRQGKNAPGETAEIGPDELGFLPRLTAVHRDLYALASIHAAEGDAGNLHLSRLCSLVRRGDPRLDGLFPYRWLVGRAFSPSACTR